MSSTYTTSNNVEKVATGEQQDVWGITLDTGFTLFDQALDGQVTVVLDGTTPITMAITAGVVSNGRNRILTFTGTIGNDVTANITPQTAPKHFYIRNQTTGGFSVIISQGSGRKVTVKEGSVVLVVCDGIGATANVDNLLTGLRVETGLDTPILALEGATSGATLLLASPSASGQLYLPAANDVLMGRNTPDAVTNKTIDASLNPMSNVPNAALLHPSMMLNSVVVNLGDTATIPAVLGHTITTGNGLTGGVYDGTANIIHAIDIAITVDKTTAQTLTNKTLTAPVLTAPVLGTPASVDLTNATNVPVNQAAGLLAVAHGGTGTATPGIVAGTNVTVSGSWPNQTVNATSTASTAFSAITGSTNTTAAMVIGSGSSLATAGSGTIAATSVTGLAVTAGKTLAATNSLTLAGTDGTTQTFPSTSATIARTDAANVFLGHQTIEGVATTGATGTGKLVFDGSPTLITPNLGVPSAIDLTHATNLPLPTASTSVLGAVKVDGTSITISGGTIAAANQVGIGKAVLSSTPKSILYADASSNLAEDNSNLQYDYTNKILNLSNPAIKTSKVNVGGGTLTTTNQDTALLVNLQTSDGGGARGLEVFELRAGAGNTSATAFYRIQRNVAGTRGCFIELCDHGINLGQSGTNVPAKVSVDTTGNLTLFESLEISTAASGPATVGIGTAPVAAQKLTISNSTSGQPTVFFDTGEVGINAPTQSSGSGKQLMVGTAYCTGTAWVSVSDRALKQDFENVDFDAILEKMATLPVKGWRYINSPNEKHLGPVAQDFAEAFQLGSDDKGLNSIDTNGVLTACVKALIEKVKRLEAALAAR